MSMWWVAHVGGRGGVGGAGKGQRLTLNTLTRLKASRLLRRMGKQHTASFDAAHCPAGAPPPSACLPRWPCASPRACRSCPGASSTSAQWWACWSAPWAPRLRPGAWVQERQPPAHQAADPAGTILIRACSRPLSTSPARQRVQLSSAKATSTGPGSHSHSHSWASRCPCLCTAWGGAPRGCWCALPRTSRASDCPRLSWRTPWTALRLPPTAQPLAPATAQVGRVTRGLRLKGGACQCQGSASALLGGPTCLSWSPLSERLGHRRRAHGVPCARPGGRAGGPGAARARCHAPGPCLAGKAGAL